MNYLAHILLSDINKPDNEDFMFGNFLGDFKKGNVADIDNLAVSNGILFHRKIDAFCDQNPVYLASKKRFSKEHYRYSGIFLDVYFDYLLATHWNTFHPKPLGEAAVHFYQVLLGGFDRHQQTIDEVTIKPAYDFYTRVANHDLLSQYGNLEVIDQVLKRISQRLSRSNPVSQGCAPLKEIANELEEDFFVFFDCLTTFSKEYQSTHALQKATSG